MFAISQADIEARLGRDNPWWTTKTSAAFAESNLPRRIYFEAFRKLALDFSIKRAAVLLGPRRVGKTVMIKQIVQEAIRDGIKRRNVLYASIDTPLYTNLSLQYFVDRVKGANDGQRCVIIFDEVQYLKDWQRHLKDLVDVYPNVKFIASGSAAAALSLQSKESGAGRFSDFMLPPLTFSEFIDFISQNELIIDEGDGDFGCEDINALNDHFIDYLNFGGYPEAVFNEAVRRNPDQFIRIDIIEKVLLKDLPSLYGIDDIQELNKLFMVLAYNSGNEISYENISQQSGVTKPTIKKYIEYLESAFLIMKISTVDENCRSMSRERNFKIYLNNPSMRAALFNPVVAENTTLIGHLAESAVFSQWQHADVIKDLRYARWRNSGEVDVVNVQPFNQKPSWVGEIKWSDTIKSNPNKEIKNLNHIMGRHSSIRSAFFTTRTYRKLTRLGGKRLKIWPTALYCYTVGRNVTSDLNMTIKFGLSDE